MVKRYESEFYNYRIPRYSSKEAANLSPAKSPQGLDPLADTVSENNVRTELSKGDDAVFKGKYYRALYHYQQAWKLFPSITDPSISNSMALVSNVELIGIDLTKHMIEASVQTLRFHDTFGVKTPIISSMEPPEKLVALSEKYAGMRMETKKILQVFGKPLFIGDL